MSDNQSFTSNYVHIDEPHDPDKYSLHEHRNDSMTISEIRRDVFAGLAMHAILVEPGGDARPYDFVAQAAYRMADAMERARKVQG